MINYFYLIKDNIAVSNNQIPKIRDVGGFDNICNNESLIFRNKCMMGTKKTCFPSFYFLFKHFTWREKQFRSNSQIENKK